MTRPASPKEQVLARLAELAALGVDGLPRGAAPPARKKSSRAAEREPAPRVEREEPLAVAEGSEVSGAELVAALDLDEMRAALGDCTRCKLCKERTQVVFGVGNPTARLMFVGEGPGRDEDLKGEPFVGRAGQLLTDMIEKGMGLARADVYIANVVKCRPPENRNPEPDEVAACAPFLARQIALVKPEAIVALGKFAAQALLSTDAPIGKLRGRWHDRAGIPVMPTFHPAYLLRDPSQKRHAWEDLKLVMAKLGIQAVR